MLLLIPTALHVGILWHLLHLLHLRHIHLHLRHLRLIEIWVVDHVHGHASLLLGMHLLQHSLSHHGLLLHLLGVARHLAKVHLRVLLLKHVLLRAEMGHGHGVAGHVTWRRRTRPLRHTRYHGTLGDLGPGNARMHTLHHARAWMATHMSAWMLHTCHRMTRTSHSGMARSHAGWKGRLRHHG